MVRRLLVNYSDELIVNRMWMTGDIDVYKLMYPLSPYNFYTFQTRIPNIKCESVPKYLEN